MNASKKYQIIWWGTAGCGSRSTGEFLRSCGLDDLYNHEVGCKVGDCAFTHTQGIPKECKGYTIICTTRNPYSRTISSYLDEKVQYGNGDDSYTFEYWFKNVYMAPNRYPTFYADFYMGEWDIIGRKPDYYLKIEDLPGTLRNIPDLEGLTINENAISSYAEGNPHRYENVHDEYIGRFQNIKKYYTQELADMVYDVLEEYFIFFNYDKDSWKTNAM